MISTEDKEKVCSASRTYIHLECVEYLNFSGRFSLFSLSFVEILKFQGKVWELIFNGVTLMEIFDDFISDKLHFWLKLSALHNGISFYQSDKHCIVTSDTFHTTKHTCPFLKSFLRKKKIDAPCKSLPVLGKNKTFLFQRRIFVTWRWFAKAENTS